MRLKKRLDPRVWIRSGSWTVVAYADDYAHRLAHWTDKLSDRADVWWIGWNYGHYGAGARPSKKEMKRLRELAKTMPRVCRVPLDHPSRVGYGNPYLWRNKR